MARSTGLLCSGIDRPTQKAQDIWEAMLMFIFTETANPKS